MNTNIDYIYIDIQSLLDLRQSVLVHKLGQEKAIEFLASSDYTLRTTDNFSCIEANEYQNLLADETIAFRNATITYLEVILKSRIAQREKLNSFKNEQKITQLLLNIHPYQLPDEAVARIVNALHIKLDSPTEIKVIREPIETFSIGYLKNSQISDFFSYFPSEWFKAHLEGVKACGRLEVKMNFPTIGKLQLTPEDEKVIRILGFNDIFAYIEFMMGMSVNVNFLPIGFYCDIHIGSLLVEKVGRAKSKEKTHGNIKEQT